ncbi:MAG: hypothetical protein EAS48_03020 [Chryseobacterium sp.]|nr:MAG: hypothetical protein EAS48_03020 [Chryseobacterium sp.]
MRNSVKVVTIVGFLLGMQMQAQQVRLTRVDKVVENADKTFYRIDPVLHEAQLLGEIEVDGYNRNTVEAFNKVYTKAKQTGANAFAVHPYETIDGGLGQIDPAHFRLLLYYTDNRSVENVNAVYLFSGVEQPQTISINNRKIEIPAAGYLKLNLQQGSVYTISTRKFLGSTIRVAAASDQAPQYFQIVGARLTQNPYGTAGINLKSGDIVKLERSYGEFLTVLYHEKRAD